MNPTRLIPAGTTVDMAVLGTHVWHKHTLAAPLRFRHARRNGDHLLIEHDGSHVCVEAAACKVVKRLPINQPARKQ